ncbi:hypothetical protein HYPSUDRAFT_54172 [Hypholoma sublateritium FD-334 SS-4]|uniref:DNA-directed RNA polymerase n=1 Tax=Hypholoma sublateritium (strain FD-334 SS-4) TaxID=945553 RepID=A0A0D2P527_HYPSF|nr:hypothetical protein HYPSUDRAFT_54172 [Hypholoma sublateritium FD-334 SS-4]
MLFGFRHRTLPHFTKDDLSPESCGFVENSYLGGLIPQDCIFHAMAGHEGLIDIAVKTAETGYIQRRLVKVLEDVMVCYYGTVRILLGDLMQFVYGEDGMDGAFIEKQNIETFSLSDRDFDSQAQLPRRRHGSLWQLPPRCAAELQAKLDEECAQLVEDRRLLRNLVFLHIFRIDRRKPSDLDPMYIVEAVQEPGKRLIVVRGEDRLSKEVQENSTLTRSIHTDQEKEWVLETDGNNLKPVVCINCFNFKGTYSESNSCLEIFNVLSLDCLT